MNETLREALAQGDPQVVAALIEAGADIHYQAEHGYNAFNDAVRGRNILHDARLIELLTLLIENHVSLTGRKSAIRLLSRIGRFDAVQLLLKAGADPHDLELTELIEAVAFGTLVDIENVVRSGGNLEGRDLCKRTAWLVAIQIGDIPKAKCLMDHGADIHAQGVCGKPPLFYAIENHHSSMIKWLLEMGIDFRQTDDFGRTALVKASGRDNVEAVDLLLQAGADVNQIRGLKSALSDAQTREVAMRLLEAGADPQDLYTEGCRAILGYPIESDDDLLSVSVEDVRTFRSRRFGATNPEKMTNPFWESMIRTGVTASLAEARLRGEYETGGKYEPTWCAKRFGQSLTFLDDGRIVQIAGEHEDRYDTEFCIYNDVFVHDANGTVTIYGYPEALFPPTDFHTASLIGNSIYLIGSLGYMGSRRYGETPVYRLNTHTFEIENLTTTGDNPGWIYKHRVILANHNEIQIIGGKILTKIDGKETQSENVTTFRLNLTDLVWSVIPPR